MKNSRLIVSCHQNVRFFSLVIKSFISPHNPLPLSPYSLPAFAPERPKELAAYTGGKGCALQARGAAHRTRFVREGAGWSRGNRAFRGARGVMVERGKWLVEMECQVPACFRWPGLTGRYAEWIHWDSTFTPLKRCWHRENYRIELGPV